MLELPSLIDALPLSPQGDGRAGSRVPVVGHVDVKGSAWDEHSESKRACVSTISVETTLSVKRRTDG